MRRLTKIIRNILLLAITAIVVTAGVLAFNVVRHGSREPQVASVPRAAVDREGLAARLSEAICFGTISSFENPDRDTEALHGLQAHILKNFPAFHAAAKREVIAGFLALLPLQDDGSPHTPGFGNPAIVQAARSVLTSRHATVIWPTPPGTGVMAPATFNASAKATSPTSRSLPSGPGVRLMPTSITVAPGLIQSPRTISGLPTAA